MTGVWDGRGNDPWLSDRLQGSAEVGQAERAIRRSFWAALSNWLVQTSRRVLRGDAPVQLDAVWARVPAWREAVDQVVQGAVKDAIGTGYRALLGSEFPWQQRQFVVRHLAEVTNRMVRTPDEVYDLIAGQVSQAVNLGEGIPEIADRVDEVLSTTRTDRWPNRATVVARTEAIGALNAGRHDAFQVMDDEDPDVSYERIWLATSDSRTRTTHRVADGQRVPVAAPFIVGGFPLMFPGDPAGPPQEVIQCRCTTLLVEKGESVNLANRGYRRLGARR